MKLTYQLPLETSERSLDLIVKQLPQDPFARFFVKEAQFDLREIKFYTKVIFANAIKPWVYKLSSPPPFISIDLRANSICPNVPTKFHWQLISVRLFGQGGKYNILCREIK